MAPSGDRALDSLVAITPSLSVPRGLYKLPVSGIDFPAITPSLSNPNGPLYASQSAPTVDGPAMRCIIAVTKSRCRPTALELPVPLWSTGRWPHHHDNAKMTLMISTILCEYPPVHFHRRTPAHFHQSTHDTRARIAGLSRHLRKGGAEMDGQMLREVGY